MERKILLASVFVTFGAIAFLSKYLLMPRAGFSNQVGSLIERFNNNGIGVGFSENKILKPLPISGRKFISFVNPFSNTGKIVAIDKGGDIIEIDTVTLNEKVIYSGLIGIIEAVLSPAGDSIVYSFYNAKNDKKYFYLNFSAFGGKNAKSAEINGDLKSVAFSPRGDQTVFLTSRSLASGSKEGELLISKGSNIIKQVLKTRIDTATINWLSDDFVSIVSSDKDGYGDLFILKDGGVLNKIISYQRNLNVRWSLSAEKLIFSAKDKTNSDRLFYKDIGNKGVVVDLDASAITSKCVWVDAESVICGLKNQAQFRDEFYKITVADGSKMLVSTPNINLLTKELAISRSGDTLFVLNDIDSKLYALKMK